MWNHHGLAAWQRRIIVALPPATTLIALPAALDATALPKLVVGTAAAVLLVLLVMTGWVRSRHITILTGPETWSALLLAVTVAISAGVAGFQASAIFGQYGRSSGLLLYASAVAIYLSIAWVADDRTVFRTVGSIVATGGLLAAMGALQGWGITNFGLESPTSPLVGTLGNPNFLSALLGVTTPLAAYLALVGAQATRWRLGAGAVGLAALGVAAWSNSVQGLVAAVAGLLIFGLFWLRARSGRRYRMGERLTVVAAGLAAAGVAISAAGIGPFASVIGERAVQFRIWYWMAALGMFGEHPVAGVGMAQYATQFRRYRSMEAFQAAGLSDAADAAHNVPLSMLAEGGFLLAGAYLLVIAVLLWVMSVGYRRLTGPRIELFGAVAGGWVAYQVQSIVSIDVPALVYIQWVLAGSMVVLVRSAGISSRRVRIPVKRRRLQRGVRAVLGGTLVLATLGFVFLARMTMADLSAASARRYAENGQGQASLEALHRAEELAPWQARYHALKGELFQQTGHVPSALDAYLSALDREPDDFPFTVTSARLAAASAQDELAQRLYDRTLVLEPNSAQLLMEVARFYADKLDNGDQALVLAERALRLSPNDGAILSLLEELDAAT
jgi:putative inorganic carbon (HCO3(-)) transporter